MTQRDKLRKALFSGRAMSAKQITAQFGIASPSKVVSQLRMEDGLPIYNDAFTDTKGRVVHKYHLGNPSRKVIAAGYRALAAVA